LELEIEMTNTLTDVEPPTPTARTFDPPLEDLVRRAAGPVLAGDDARVAAEVATFNLAHMHRPAVVVGATCAEDVAAAVSWAVANGLPVAAQATGHGPVRAVEDALLITTSRMSSVDVDPERRTAKVGAGVRWADVIEAAAPHGLTGVSGSSSSVGVVGYSLGGGMGSLSRHTASVPTTCTASSWSPPTVGSATSTPRPSRTCSGRSEAARATSVSSPLSRSGSFPS